MSATVPEIHAFAYRSPRLECHLPLEFFGVDGTLFGVATNISFQGLLVRFAEPVLPQTTGRVRIRFERCTVELEALVTHADSFIAGISFTFASERERAFIKAVIQALATTG